jgi:glyoxylase-like metal-dependent hydrolase (beta-lactamase superfamily II)
VAELVAPGVWWLSGTRGSNVFLVESGDALALVDSGFGSSLDAIVAEVDRVAPGRTPTHLLLTHAHGDHAGAARTLRERYRLAVVAGAGDCIVDASGEATLRPMAAPTPPWHRLARRLRGRRTAAAASRPTPVDVVIDAEREIAGLHAVPTPGHTPGSVCYLLEDRDVAFVGDLVISHPDGLARPLHFINHDDTQYLETLRSFAERAPEIGFAGHGPPVLEGFGEQLRELASEPRRSLLSPAAAIQRLRRLRGFARNIAAQRR